MATKSENRQVNIYLNTRGGQRSMRELRSESAKLAAEINRLTPGTEKWIQKTRQLQGVKRQISDLNKEIRGTDSWLQRVGLSSNSVFKGMMAASIVTTLLFGVQSALGGIFNTIRQFEAEASSLAAILGIDPQKDAAAFEFLQEQAISMASTSSKTSTEVLKAMKVVGSVKPELLSNTEVLAAYTKEIITLSEATGETVDDMATVVGATMNQFGAGADQVARYTNAFAAGSQAGAANVRELGEAMDKSGGVAANYNLSIEEQIGLLETLAEKNLKGAEAGTQLRGMLIKMQTLDVLPPKAQEALEKYGVNVALVTDKTRPMAERLRELSKISEDTGAMVHVFGEQNIVAGQAILQNVDAVERYTEAVTGTNVANEQAATNTDNLDGAMKRVASAWEALVLSMRSGTGFLTAALDWLARNLETIVKVVLVAGSAFVSYHAALRLVTIAKGVFAAATTTARLVTIAFTGGIGKLQLALKAMGVTMAATPWGIVAALVGAAIVAYQAFSDSADQVTIKERALNNVRMEANKQIQAEITSLEQNLKIAQNKQASDEARQKAVKQLRDATGDYLKDLTDEQIKMGQGIPLIEKFIAERRKQAEATAAMNLITQQATKLMELEAMKADELIGTWDGIALMAQSIQNGDIFDEQTLLTKIDKKAEKERSKRKAAIEQEIKVYEAKLAELAKGGTIPDLNDNEDDDEPSGNNGNNEAERAREAERKKQEAVLEEAEKGLEEIKEMLADAAEERIREGLTAEQREIRAVEQKYAKELEALQGHIDAVKTNELLSEEERNAKLKEFYAVQAMLTDQGEQEKAEIKQKYADQEEKRRQEILDQLDEATKTEQQRELDGINEHYDELLKLADEVGYDKQQIEAMRAAELLVAKQKYATAEVDLERQKFQQIQQLYGHFGQIITNLFAIAGKSQGDFIMFQKALTLAQIAIDTASAISAMTKIGVTSSVTPIQAAVQIAGGIATILANIATAKATLSSAEVPQFTPSSGGEVPAFADGGFTYPFGGSVSKGGFVRKGILGTFGEEGTEFVINNRSLRNPAILDFARTIDAVQTGRVPAFRDGGFTGPGLLPSAGRPTISSAASTDPEMKAIMLRLDATIQGLTGELRKGIKAGVVYQEIARAADTVQQFNRNSSF